jgi:hypothetical protein
MLFSLSKIIKNPNVPESQVIAINMYASIIDPFPRVKPGKRLRRAFVFEERKEVRIPLPEPSRNRGSEERIQGGGTGNADRNIGNTYT